MKKDQVQILHVKFGKIIEIDYFDRTDARNHSIEDDQMAHRDLKNSLLAFKDDMAEAYYSLSHSLSEHFTPNEVSVTEKKGTFFITVKGKFQTVHEDSITVNTGIIPMSDEPTDDLVVKLNTLRTELWEYFWNEKADGKLPFPKEEVPEATEEENTILEK